MAGLSIYSGKKGPSAFLLKKRLTPIAKLFVRILRNELLYLFEIFQYQLCFGDTE